MRLIVTFLSLLSISFTAFASNLDDASDWPTDEEVWIDELSDKDITEIRLRGPYTPEVIRTNQGLLVQTAPAPEVYSCLIHGQFKSIETESFKAIPSCFYGESSNRIQLDRDVILSKVWMVAENTRRNNSCRIVPTRLNQQLNQITFNKNIPHGCYTIVYKFRSQSLKKFEVPTINFQGTASSADTQIKPYFDNYLNRATREKFKSEWNLDY